MATAGQTIGLLGGSFDPAHYGHVHITRWALKRFRLDRVWWLVSPGNPLKKRAPAPLSERIAFAKERLGGDPRVEVTGIEAMLGTRKTIDTLRALQQNYPAVRFVWIMGTDNLAQFHRWDSWREIAERVPLAIVARPGSRLSARFSPAARALARFRLSPEAAPVLARRVPPAWCVIDIPLNALSSTAIRAGQVAATAYDMTPGGAA